MAGNIYDDAVDQLPPVPAPAAAPTSPAPTPNPYDAVIDTLDAGNTQALKTSMVQASGTTPDRAADVQRLSAKTGIASDIIERNFDAIQKRALLTDTPYAQMQRETPAVASWASEPANAAVAKDDMESLGALEWLVKAPSRALAQGIDSTRYALLRAESITRDLTQAEQDQLNAYKFGMQNGGELGASSSWFRGAITGLMKNIPMLFGAGIAANKYGMVGAAEVGAAGAIAGSVIPGAGTVAGFTAGAGAGYSAGALYGGFKFGAQLAAGQAYDELLGFKDELGRPLDPQVAKTAALATGLINGALMTGGFKLLAETIPGLDKLGGVLTTSAVKQALLQPTVRAGLLEAAKTFGGTLSFETANMVAQRAAQILIGDVAKERSGQPFTIRDAGDTAADLGQTALGALRDFALLTAAGPAAGFAIDRLRAGEALHNATFFHALGEGVAQSKTGQRLPEALQSLLETATKDGPVETVYAPIASWSTYWQSKGVDPSEMAARVTGDPQAFDRATRTGEDLAIPTATYATTLAATEHNAFFANELRLAPEQMNAREAQDFQQKLVDQQQADAASAKASAVHEAAAPVRENITRQLEAAGIERSTAENYATLYEHTFQTLGERAGIDPVELFNRYGLTIERPDLVDRTADAAHNPQDYLNVKPLEPDTARETAAAEEGSGLPDRSAEQPHVDQSGLGQGPGDGGSVEPRRIPAAPALDETFERRPLEDTVARLTPEVRQELTRILDEMETFPFTERTWHWLESGEKKTGNAAGGDANVVPGSAGAAVYDDVRHFSPVNKITVGKRKGEPAKEVRGTRADVADAIRKLIETGDVHNNLAEGALRVAEHRAAGDYSELNHPELPPSWGTVAPVEFTDRLSTAIDGALESDSVETGEGDVSFDPTEFNQAPRPEFVAVGGEENENADRQALQQAEAQQRAEIAQTGETDPAKAALRDATQGGGKVRVLYQLPTQPEKFSSYADAAAAAAPGERVRSVTVSGGPPEFVIETHVGKRWIVKVSSDILDTGEQQSRLPGDAGNVREQNVQTPTFEAPFSLTSEVANEKAGGGQGSLFQDARGVIRIGANHQMRIDLLKGADLSTFLHESGHLFLEVLRDVAKEPGAESIRADLATLDAWLTDEDHTGTGYSVKQHEQFARGFEAYLMEGKAPSAELRPVFARFRAWLVGVYRSLKGLNVELTPEVRGVFDRLVASDTAIEQAQAEGHVSPLFTDAAMAGMTPDAFDAYRATVQAASDQAKDELQTKLLRDFTREQQAWWKSERETTRADVAAEAGKEPIFRALAAIQKGTHPDGSPLIEGKDAEPMRLAKSELVDRYTPEELKALRRRQLYAADGGVSPDVVAQLTGFSSGDELVRALLTAPSMKDTIERATDARMTAKHGDLLIDGRLSEQAQQAVYGEGRQQVIHAELKALTAGMVKGTIPPAAVINAAAEQRIADTRVRDIRPGQFLMAARRASQRAFDLLSTQQDRAGAVQAKQQELINLALYREATKAREGVDSAVTYLRSFDTAAKRERIGKAGADYLEQIDGLRQRFDLSRQTLKAIDRRQALAAWAAAKEASTGLPLELPAELLNEARRGHYTDLTVNELQGVRDGVRMIEHLATLKNKLLKAQAGRELAAAAADVVTSIGEHSNGPREMKLETRLPGSATSRNIATFFASHRKLSSLLREMDGFKDGGVLWESVMRPLNEAADAESVRNEQATIALRGIFDAYKGEETTLYHSAYIPAIGDSLTKMGRLMVALNWGNDGNRARIRDGYHWTDEQVGAILKTLDARDWTFVQGVWDHINSYWPDIAAKERRVTGVEPEKVEAAPIQTSVGEQRGGYFPIKYEHELSARAAANLEGGFADGVKQAAYVRATTQRGHTEARVAKVSEPVRLDFGVITEHVQQVIHDLTHHETLLDVGRVLAHRDVQDAIYKHYGPVAYDQIKGAVRDIAFGNTPAPGWYKTLNAIRAKTVTATLGWNAVTSLMHSLQITRGMVRVGPGYVLHGLGRWLSSAKNAEGSVGWIEAQSDMMRLRWKTQQRELNEVRNRVGFDRGKVSAAVHDVLAKAGVDPGHMPEIADSYFYAIRRIVQFAEIPTWIGAYEKAMADQSNDHARSVALANQAVEDSMGSGQIKDLAAVQRAPMAKLLTTFYDYHNAVYQQAYELVKSNEAPGRKMVDASLLLFVPVALGAALHHVASTRQTKTSTVAELSQDGVDYGLNMFVGLRELAGAFTGRDYTGPAGLRFIPTLRNFVYRVGQGEPNAATAKAANETAGELFGYPAKQVERTATGIQALWSGKTKDLSAVVFGGPKEASR